MRLDCNEILTKAAECVGGWKELEEKLGVSRQTIWQWQHNKRVPNAVVIVECLHLIAQHRPHLIKNAVDRIEKKAS
jgi:transcriptional regulator with XRE-family HTH domain